VVSSIGMESPGLVDTARQQDVRVATRNPSQAVDSVAEPPSDSYSFPAQPDVRESLAREEEGPPFGRAGDGAHGRG